MSLSRRSLFKNVGFGIGLTWLPWRSAFGTDISPIFQSSPSNQTDGFIHLDRNHNPYGPSPRVQECLRSAVSTANRYPGSEREALIEALAQTHKVSPNQIAIGCGSTELLRAAAAVFLGPQRHLMTATPTFEGMEYYAREVGAGLVSLPLTRLFAHDLERMRTRIDKSTGLVYICNPNNPTASLTPRSDIEHFLSHLPSTNACILIDEAYHHYAGESDAYSSFLDHPVADERVLVTRTFSQVYGLAALRLGYVVGAPKLIHRLSAMITLDSVNSVVARSAMVALQDAASTADFINRNENVRQEFLNQSGGRMLKPISSHANFVMMDAHLPADRVLQHFRDHSILLGPVIPSMPTHVRISLGTLDEMQEFWRVWDLLPVTEMPM